MKNIFLGVDSLIPSFIKFETAKEWNIVLSTANENMKQLVMLDFPFRC